MEVYMKKVSAGMALLALLAGLAVSSCEPMIFGDYEDSTGIFGGGKEGGLSAPTLTVSVSPSGGIYLSWNSVSGASDYRIYRSTSGSGGSYSVIASTYSTYYTDTGGSTAYYYKVAARDYDDNEGTRSSAVSAGGGGLATLPAPSTVYAYGSSSSSIQITWDYISDASGYRVYRSNSSTGTYSDISGITPGGAYSTSYNDTGLLSKRTYYYKVATVNSSGTTGSMSTSYYDATTN
jgi:fibronectin type 3 domain-containing protein